MLQNFKNGIANKKLNTLDRLGIIRDGFDLSESGQYTTLDALSLVLDYKDEIDYTVWLEIATKIHRIAGLVSDDKDLFDLYKPFAKEIFSKAAKRVGWEKKKNEKHTDFLLRAVLLYGFGTYGDLATIKVAKDLFSEYLKSGSLDSNLRGVVYNLVAENSGEKEYEI